MFGGLTYWMERVRRLLLGRSLATLTGKSPHSCHLWLLSYHSWLLSDHLWLLSSLYVSSGICVCSSRG